jgi:formate/nitrite transporter FocA (FNT family)
MRIETIRAWIFVGFGLLLIGALIYLLQISKLATFVAVMGAIYFAIGMLLIVSHDQHMAKRTRAGRESHR